MKIEYKIDESDFLMYQLFVASKSERIKRKRLRNKLVMPLIYLVLGLLLFCFSYKIWSSVFCFVIAIVWYFIYPLWEKRHYVNHYRRFIKENYQNRFGKSTILEFTDVLIKVRDPVSEGSVLITELEEINEIPTSIFIKIKTGQSFILPKQEIINITTVRNRLKEIAVSLNITYHFYDKWEWK